MLEPHSYLIIILASITLYIGIGFLFITHICDNYHWLKQQTEENPLIAVWVLALWHIVFIVFITIRTWEVINLRQDDDWWK